jgi:clan AA aspartic protease
MGLVHVDMKVSAPGKAARTVRFLIDSGAAYSVLPQPVWKALKLKPKRTLEFTLADGTTITRDVSECRFAFCGIDAASPVVLGEERDEALLGVVTLENLGLVLNFFERTLSPMRMMLARLRPATSAQATAGAAHAAGSITARSSP